MFSINGIQEEPWGAFESTEHHRCPSFSLSNSSIRFMNRPARHTTVRISLRSLFGIIFGLSIVMAIVAPFIREMSPQAQVELAIFIGLLMFSSLFGCYYLVRRRHRIARECGPLLVRLKVEQIRLPKSRWIWLIVGLPLMVFYSFTFTRVIVDSNPFEEFSFELFHNGFATLLIQLFYLMLVLFMFGSSLAREALKHWAEGYADEIEFCENGIVLPEGRFLKWESESLRSVSWGTEENELLVNVNRSITKYVVVEGQCQEVVAILEKYLKR